MSGEKSEWIYDELLCFLGSAFFQAPVTGFMEEYCLIFDPSVEDSEEYKNISHQYKKLVQTLLDAFCKDTKLSHDEIIKALNDMNSKKDIREIFLGLFEQVLAMDDYEVFVRLMTQKNIELQQQALMLILKTTGALPDSLKEGGQSEPAAPSSQQAEDEIMRKILEQSKREYEEEQKKRAKKDEQDMDKLFSMSKLEVNQLEAQKQVEQQKLNQTFSDTSLKEQPPAVPKTKMVKHPKPAQLEHELPAMQIFSNTSLKDMPSLLPVTVPVKPTEPAQSKQNPPAMQAVANVSLKDMPPIAPVTGTVRQTETSQSKPKPPAPQVPVQKKAEVPVIKTAGEEKSLNKGAVGGSGPTVSQTKLGPGLLPQSRLPAISSSQAAANWMKSAQDESTNADAHASAVQKAAAAMAGMNAEEIKKRQEYLRQQRDKLVSMKKKEREKQLLTAEQSNPGRPMSAAAARQSMKQNMEQESGKKELSAEEKKKIEMRKAIADRLKAEVIGK